MGNMQAAQSGRTSTKADPFDAEIFANRNDRWLTPLAIIRALGTFDLDPCAAPGHDTAIERWTPEEVGDGLSKNVKVHQLVAQAFLGAAPEGKTLVLHTDGNHLNNRADNLRWGNYSDNARDSLRHGTWRNQHTVDAHSEPKPEWRDAKPGEVWELDFDGDLIAVTVSEDLFFERASSRGEYITFEHLGIHDGRRIWPVE